MFKKGYLFILPFIFIFFSCDVVKQAGNVIAAGNNNTGLQTSEIATGLKEALRVGTDSATRQLSSVNGFFANAAIKVLMPPEAKKVESTLRDFGMGKLVDNAILSMNRAAEDATKSAAPIIWNAIKGISIQDAVGILKGGDFAATNYLQSRTATALTASFAPVIEESLQKTNATKYWKDVFTAYNRFSKNPVDTDLTSYVTGKALDGIFHEIGLEEQKIRQDPAARVTDILKKVFAQQ